MPHRKSSKRGLLDVIQQVGQGGLLSLLQDDEDDPIAPGGAFSPGLLQSPLIMGLMALLKKGSSQSSQGFK